ncbi:type II toxin-antitoxin system VapC family toxin [Runella limosa]|uniref:type II toxin-antitoxin system VapC family toxin n=1 Tax=Runella limosa TaxID=370978 RepID=UPI00042592F3|nr:type II toxin-antitoxin system VapC family toxin [Runella limosa]
MVVHYLIDSSIVSKYLDGLLSDKGFEFMDFVFEVESNISIITKIELLSWVTSDKSLYRQVEIFIEDSKVYSLTDEIVIKTIDLRRKYRLKTPDAIIGATALVHKLTVLTDNERDFQAIKNLKVINPNRL